MADEVAQAQGPVQGRAWEVVRLIGQGFGRNEIARMTGVSTATVSRIAQRNGLSFDRTQTEKALKARIADLNLRQAGLAESLADRVAIAIAYLDASANYRDWAFASKAIGDLTQAYIRMKPQRDEGADLEDTKDFLVDLKKQLGAVRDDFERMHGVPFDSDEAKRIINQEDSSNDES
ncbi:hypothetical protein [Streptomyces pini]|uniref:Homeodomain-like domain-containing protein n=1 Tax=Streptomyces pini TaxID=1520580 RepID=A0A1I4EJP0_9ACTN|nr:hypothetical protein [Streptomyces pini]SFL04787.1 hypothetical protein SAMN05192584_11266 [Streptomyces pini]